MHSVIFWYVLLLRLLQAFCETCAKAALADTIAANATATMTDPRTRPRRGLVPLPSWFLLFVCPRLRPAGVPPRPGADDTAFTAEGKFSGYNRARDLGTGLLALAVTRAHEPPGLDRPSPFASTSPSGSATKSSRRSSHVGE